VEERTEARSPGSRAETIGLGTGSPKWASSSLAFRQWSGLCRRRTGISLAHRDWGDVGAPVMVLLHATGESSASWAALAPALARSFRVVAVDLRRHGNSDWPGAYSLEAMRDDVLGLLDDLGDAAVALSADYGVRCWRILTALLLTGGIVFANTDSIE